MAPISQEVAKEISSYIPLAELLIYIILPGFFGGIVSALFEFLKIVRPLSKDGSAVDCSTCAFFSTGNSNTAQRLEIIFYRALIGVGGAFGVIFLGLWVGKVSIEDTIQNRLLLISLCTVAGVVSFKLLPGIGSKLEEHLLQKKINETDQKADKAIKNSSGAISYSSAIAHADTALTRTDYHDAPQAIERLELLKVDPAFECDRTLNIKLGRLYRMTGDLDKAIITLRNFISKKRELIQSSKPQPNDYIDISDAYFNIACYHSLKAEKLPGGNHNDEERNRLISEACEALKSSVSNWKGNVEFAEGDPDLKFIKKKDLAQFQLAISV